MALLASSTLLPASGKTGLAGTKRKSIEETHITLHGTCRERKKAAARELEERVQALADEAAKLELVKTRHQELQVGSAGNHMHTWVRPSLLSCRATEAMPFVGSAGYGGPPGEHLPPSWTQAVTCTTLQSVLS